MRAFDWCINCHFRVKKIFGQFLLLGSLPEKNTKIILRASKTIYTLIESPHRLEKKYAVFKDI